VPASDDRAAEPVSALPPFRRLWSSPTPPADEPEASAD
jgi:hypothetical protein